MKLFPLNVMWCMELEVSILIVSHNPCYWSCFNLIDSERDINDITTTSNVVYGVRERQCA